MDGNGRWAVQRDLERVRGHQQGAQDRPRPSSPSAPTCRKHRGGPDYLTLYSFSLENWKRPANEVSFLMQMYIDYLRQERATMMENNIRFRQIGRLDHLPEPVLDEVAITLEETKNNNGLTLVLALNYGSRAEITDAVRAIAEKVTAGELDPRDIDEETISRPPLHRRHARPGPADPHRRRDAREQLPALADQLRGVVRQPGAVAGLRRGVPARGDAGVRASGTGGLGALDHTNTLR